jgi:hypothetical protein
MDYSKSRCYQMANAELTGPFCGERLCKMERSDYTNERSKMGPRAAFGYGAYSSLLDGTRPINPAFLGGGFSFVLYQRESGTQLLGSNLSLATHSGR